jgi:hypothetical protein
MLKSGWNGGNNCYLTVWRIAEEQNTNRKTVRLVISKDLNMKKVCVKKELKNMSDK